MKPAYAVHSHVGVYWDGGVHLLGVYRWLWVARLRCWWHVRMENAYRIGTVRPVIAGYDLPAYSSNGKAWDDLMRALRPIC